MIQFHNHDLVSVASRLSLMDIRDCRLVYKAVIELEKIQTFRIMSNMCETQDSFGSWKVEEKRGNSQKMKKNLIVWLEF